MSPYAVKSFSSSELMLLLVQSGYSTALWVDYNVDDGGGDSSGEDKLSSSSNLSLELELRSITLDLLRKQLLKI